MHVNKMKELNRSTTNKLLSVNGYIVADIKIAQYITMWENVEMHIINRPHDTQFTLFHIMFFHGTNKTTKICACDGQAQLHNTAETSRRSTASPMASNEARRGAAMPLRLQSRLLWSLQGCSQDCFQAFTSGDLIPSNVFVSVSHSNVHTSLMLAY